VYLIRNDRYALEVAGQLTAMPIWAFKRWAWSTIMWSCILLREWWGNSKLTSILKKLQREAKGTA